jgi:hypothetical protein
MTFLSLTEKVDKDKTQKKFCVGVRRKIEEF